MKRILIGFERIMTNEIPKTFKTRSGSSLDDAPFDLDTLKARLENGFYRRIAAVKFDVKELGERIPEPYRIITDVLMKVIE